MFSTLNELMASLTKKKNVDYKYIKKELGKKHRLMYLGMFMVMVAVFMAMIEISDGVDKSLEKV